MVAAIEHRHFQVDHRISRQKSTRRRLPNPLLYRRNILPRNRPPEDLVSKHHAAAPWHRLHPNLAIAVLPMASRLLLVSSLRLRATKNRLAIRYLRRLQSHVRVISPLKLRNNRFNMLLPRPSHQKLIRLWVTEEL